MFTAEKAGVEIPTTATPDGTENGGGDHPAIQEPIAMDADEA